MKEACRTPSSDQQPIALASRTQHRTQGSVFLSRMRERGPRLCHRVSRVSMFTIKKLSLESRIKSLALRKMLIAGKISVHALPIMSLLPVKELVSMPPLPASITTKSSMDRAWNLKCQGRVCTGTRVHKTADAPRPWDSRLELLSHLRRLEWYSIRVRNVSARRPAPVSTTKWALSRSLGQDHMSTRTIQWSKRASTCQWSTLTSFDTL